MDVLSSIVVIRRDRVRDEGPGPGQPPRVDPRHHRGQEVYRAAAKLVGACVTYDKMTLDIMNRDTMTA